MSKFDNRTINIVEKIIKEQVSSFNPSESGLLTGETGVLLLLEKYSKIGKVDNSTFQNTFENVVVSNQYNRENSHGKGITGNYWLYSYLNKRNILDNETYDSLCVHYQKLKDHAIFSIRESFYDFLFGSIGIGRLFLYNLPNNNLDFFDIYFQELIKQLQNPNNIFYSYSINDNKVIKDEIDVGLAHGVLGILKFCVDCYNNKVCKKEAVIVITAISSFLLKHRNKSQISYYPFKVNLTSSKKSNSRLAWCYGDLVTGYLLYQASKVLNDDNLMSFSLEVLINTTHRTEAKKNGVFDTGICHGSSSLAYIYHKLWNSSSNIVFKEASDYWRNVTFKYIFDKNIGLGKYDPLDKTYQADKSLLEGSIGVGLVLLSMLDNDFEWDYCILLNE